MMPNQIKTGLRLKKDKVVAINGKPVTGGFYDKGGKANVASWTDGT